MRKRNHSNPSSDDDIPVKLLKKPMSSHLKELMKDAVQSCEFCDKVCYNKYTMLIHNVNHMIIPLLKSSISKCPTCNRYFPSQKELYIHKEIYHHKIPHITSYLNEPLIIGNKIENIDLTEELNTGKLNGNNDLKKNNYIHLSDETTLRLIEKDKINERLENDRINGEGKVEKAVKNDKIKEVSNKTTLRLIDKDKINGRIENDRKSNGEDELEKKLKEKAKVDNIVIYEYNSNTQQNGTFCNTSVKDKKINGVCTEIIISDSDSETSNDCVINEEIQNNIGMKNVIQNVKNNDKSLNGIKTTDEGKNNEKCEENKTELLLEDDELNDIINIGDDNKNNNLLMIGSKVNGVEFAPSVHYEDLKELGHFECIFCEMDFTSRYDLILHETNHINLKPPKLKPPLCTICDYYIAGNHYSLKQHREEKHKEIIHFTTTTRTCTKCNLKYRSIFKHYHNYHLLYTCPACFNKFEQEAERDKHTSLCTGEKFIDKRMGVSKEIKVCEMCILFLKENVSHKYVVLGDFSRTGFRVTCERCEKKFFEVKLVRMICKEKMAMTKVAERKPVSSNVERLRKMQRRLKKLNK